MRRASLIVFLLAVACSSDSTSPATSVQGTYIGAYTATVQPGVVYQGVLQLTQSGSSISGTLTTNAGRAATVTGSVSGTRITATFTYTDACQGSSSSTADVTNGGTRLVGNYTTSDCLGQYSGGYNLTKQ
jgi:hypothetical protein